MPRLFIIFFFVNLNAFGQIDVKGTVRDDEQRPISGVNIVMRGTVKGTISNGEGKFSLKAPVDSVVLIFTFIGYEAQVVKVFGDDTLDVVLHEQKSLSGGYWESKRNVKPISKKRIKTGTLTIYSRETISMEENRLPSRVVVWQQEKYKVVLPLDSLIAVLNTNYSGRGDVDQAIRSLRDNIQGDTVTLPKTFIQSVGELTLNNLAIEMIKRKSIVILKLNGDKVKSLIILDAFWVGRKCANCCWGGIEFLVSEDESGLFTITHIIC